MLSFSWSGSPFDNIRTSLLALFLAGGLAWLATRGPRAEGTSRRQLVATAGLAALAWVLGLLPFVPLHQIIARTIFLAAPPLAVFLACCLCLVVSGLPRLLGRLAVAACLGYLAVVTVIESNREQNLSNT